MARVQKDGSIVDFELRGDRRRAWLFRWQKSYPAGLPVLALAGYREEARIDGAWSPRRSLKHGADIKWPGGCLEFSDVPFPPSVVDAVAQEGRRVVAVLVVEPHEDFEEKPNER